MIHPNFNSRFATPGWRYTIIWSSGSHVAKIVIISYIVSRHAFFYTLKMLRHNTILATNVSLSFLISPIYDLRNRKCVKSRQIYIFLIDSNKSSLPSQKNRDSSKSYLHDRQILSVNSTLGVVTTTPMWQEHLHPESQG